MTIAISSYGFSNEAECVDEMMRKDRDHLHKSSAFGIESVLRDELAAVWSECQTANWDGHNAPPVSKDAWWNARDFLEALPLGIRRPSIGADPHGYVSLEWYNNPRRVLSISISADDLLHYAAILGASNTCGTEVFFGEVPSILVDLVDRVYS